VFDNNKILFHLVPSYPAKTNLKNPMRTGVEHANELVTSQVNPQQHKQPTNTTTMVMEPLIPPAVWIQ
jgi:hypothetical protein